MLKAYFNFKSDINKLRESKNFLASRFPVAIRFLSSFLIVLKWCLILLIIIYIIGVVFAVMIEVPII